VKIPLRLVLMLLALVTAMPTWAADLTGQIRGQVTDTDGIPIPGATIRITSPALLGENVSQSDTNGLYRAVKLPVGEYRVEASKPSFNTWVAEGVRVTLGGTASVDVRLSLAEEGEAIIVVDELPVVDVENVQSGINLSSEMLRDLPTGGRDYQSALAVAPGVVGSGNANIRGGMDSANQFYVDGVNNTDPVTNTFSMNMNYDAIEELQVITGGMDAEYGRSLGGAVNIVTKSGGNELEVLASAFYSDENFEIYTPMDDEEAQAREERDYSSQQYALNIGGPIVKDKVWFFTSAQMDLYRDATFLSSDVVRPTGPDPITGDPMDVVADRDWRSYYLFGKITAQLAPQHRVWIHGQADPTRIDNVDQGAYTLPSAEQAQDQGGWLGSVGHIWMPNDNMNVETQLYVQRGYIYYYPQVWDGCQNWEEQPGNGHPYDTCGDDFAGMIGNAYGHNGWVGYGPEDFSLGEFPYAYLGERNRYSINSALTYYASVLGEHEIKIGFQGELLDSWNAFPGLEEQYALYSATGDPTDLSSYEPVGAYIYNNDGSSTIQGTMLSWFVQDVWQPVSRLTLRPGVRFDQASLKNDVGDTVIANLNASPRLGLAWDVMGDRRTNVHAYYGRFVDPGFLSVADLLKDLDGGWGYYGWDEETQDWSTEATFAVNDTFLKADGLQVPYSDEFDLGVTRQVGDNLSFDVTYTREVARNFWEDDEVNLIWDDTGTNVVGYRNGENISIFRLRTSDELYTSYNSIEAVVNANLDYWWLNASYVWSRAFGTSDDQIATFFYDVPQQNQFYEGFLSYDRTHAVKVNGTYRNTEAWTVGRSNMGYLYGWNFRMFSGTPYNKVYYNNYFADWSNLLENNDGTYRLPGSSTIDLRGGLTADVGPTTWALTLDCFNVLNNRAVTSVQTIYGAEDGDGAYLDADGNPIFGEPLTFQSPRRFQIGLRGEF
jgi:hypothetical protein